MQEFRDRMQREGGNNGGRGGRGGDANGGNNGGRGNTGGRGRNGASLTPGRSTPTTTGVIRRASYQPQDGFGGYGQGFGGGFGGNPYTGEPQQGVDPAVQRQMMQRQQQAMQDQQAQFRRQQTEGRMQQTMQKLRKDEETGLAKILKPEQLKRLREISLQLEGPFAILRNQELAQKLNVTEDQYARIQDIEQADRERRRNNGGGFGGGGGEGMRSLMEKFRATQPQNQNQGNDNGGGRGGRGNFDREAFQKFLEKPENKAEMDKIREQGEKARAAEAAARDQNFSKVLATLDRGQASKYRAALGEKFNTDNMMRGMFGGPGGPGGNRTPPAGGATANADTPKADTPKAEAPKAEAASATNATKSAAPAARSGSLRDRRGLGATTKPQ